MKVIRIIWMLVALSVAANAQTTFVKLITSKGNITLLLFDETPLHRDMFLESIRKGLFNDAQFNRVIKSFVSQGGELDETILDREKLDPQTPLQRIPAEIKPTLFHKKGALGMGRNDNPDKSSYLTQIYLVEGKLQTDAQLDALEQKKGLKFPLSQRAVYKAIGGVPNLDNDYTIFGEIIEGMDVAEAINSVSTNVKDVPLTPVTFKPIILSEKEALKLRKKTNK